MTEKQMPAKHADDAIACPQTVIHEDIVAHVEKMIPPEETLYDVADFFKTLGDSTRIRIVSALLVSELCVCDIAAVLDMNISAVSHQLRMLKQAKIVRPRREGKVIYYSLADDHVQMLFATALAHVEE